MRVRRRSKTHAFVCAAAVALFAAGSGGCLPTIYNKRPEVKGTVRDTTGAPIKGATVRITKADKAGAKPAAAAKSDAQGRFKVPGAPQLGLYWFFAKPREWTWNVQAEAPGHTSGSVALPHRGKLPRSTFANVKFRLPPQ